jgi:hypothetical protein
MRTYIINMCMIIAHARRHILLLRRLLQYTYLLYYNVMYVPGTQRAAPPTRNF